MSWLAPGDGESFFGLSGTLGSFEASFLGMTFFPTSFILSTKKPLISSSGEDVYACVIQSAGSGSWTTEAEEDLPDDRLLEIVLGWICLSAELEPALTKVVKHCRRSREK